MCFRWFCWLGSFVRRGRSDWDWAGWWAPGRQHSFLSFLLPSSGASPALLYWSSRRFCWGPRWTFWWSCSGWFRRWWGLGWLSTACRIAPQCSLCSRLPSFGVGWWWAALMDSCTQGWTSCPHAPLRRNSFCRSAPGTCSLCYCCRGPVPSGQNTLSPLSVLGGCSPSKQIPVVWPGRSPKCCPSLSSEPRTCWGAKFGGGWLFPLSWGSWWCTCLGCSWCSSLVSRDSSLFIWWTPSPYTCWWSCRANGSWWAHWW